MLLPTAEGDGCPSDVATVKFTYNFIQQNTKPIIL